MASLKYKNSPRKKPNSELDVIVSSLRKENAYLKKTLVELSRQLSERNKLIEVNLVKLLSQTISSVSVIFSQHWSTSQDYSHCTVNNVASESCAFLMQGIVKQLIFQCLFAEIPLS